jgi:hypothetical protein
MVDQTVMTEQEFQAATQAFVAKLGTQMKPTDNIGIVLNGAMHFAAFMLAQHILMRAAEEPTDLAGELQQACCVLQNATAVFLNQLQTQQAAGMGAATEH